MNLLTDAVMVYTVEHMTNTAATQITAANPRPLVNVTHGKVVAWLDSMHAACAVALENLLHVADAACVDGDMSVVADLLAEIEGVETLRDSLPVRRAA